MNVVISLTLLAFAATVGLVVTAILSLSYAYADTANATLTTPILKDATGRELSSPAKVGQLVIISTTLQANSSGTASNGSVPFVIIIEVRDELGISHYSQFALGSLNPDARSEVGLSWTPKQAGTYQLKAFALSDLNNPQILAPAHSSLTRIEQ